MRGYLPKKIYPILFESDEYYDEIADWWLARITELEKGILEKLEKAVITVDEDYSRVIDEDQAKSIIKKGFEDL